jgi:type IV pilus assembly protein PilA
MRLMRFTFKKLRKLRSAKIHQAAFTLIELMVVVGILGILVSISTARFEMYQRKARQSEAKINLSAIYAAEKSFHSEYDAYIPAFDAIGYLPEGQKRFYQQNACNNDGPYTGTVTGYSSSQGSWVIDRNTTGMFAWGGANPATTCPANSVLNCSAYGNDPQTFNVNAVGQLCATCYIDVWVMTQNKSLSNCSSGLR